MKKQSYEDWKKEGYFFGSKFETIKDITWDEESKNWAVNFVNSLKDKKIIKKII